MVPGPVAGLPVPRQVGRDDVAPGRRQRRPDPPPDPADAVMPWTRTSGRSAASPQASDENGMPAASVTDRVPGSTASGGAARTAATAAGRSDMPGRYQPAAGDLPLAESEHVGVVGG